MEPLDAYLVIDQSTGDIDRAYESIADATRAVAVLNAPLNRRRARYEVKAILFQQMSDAEKKARL